MTKLGPIVGIMMFSIFLMIYIFWNTENQLIFNLPTSNVLLWGFLVLTFLVATIYTLVCEMLEKRGS